MAVTFRSFVLVLFPLFFAAVFAQLKSPDLQKPNQQNQNGAIAMPGGSGGGIVTGPYGMIIQGGNGSNDNDNNNQEDRSMTTRKAKKDKRRKGKHHKKGRKHHKKHRKNRSVDYNPGLIEKVVPLQDSKANEIPAGVKPDLETDFIGSWILHSPNSGVSAMHIQLMPNTSKAIWFDATGLGPSAVKIDPPFCRAVPRSKYKDCYAHGIEYDIETAKYRTLTIFNNPWCSSGGLSPKGELISAGGSDYEGLRAIRIIRSCDDCQFEEKPFALSANRWYATQVVLEDGSFLVAGGRGSHSYEIIPHDTLDFPIKPFGLPLLFDTEDEKENNLYPFLFLAPDGNVMIFANNKSIIVNPQTGETLREFPDLPGGSRNYPASASASLLPLKLNEKNMVDDAEVMICGGNTHDAFKYSEHPPRKWFPAFKDCGRISITQANSTWDIDYMPSGRVMGDMVLLPNAQILIINGARKGTSGWYAADDPNLTPVLYNPELPKGQRFKELAPSTIPRMYHSSSAVLPDGQILVAGSNANSNYDFDDKYPTQLTVEKFSPPYLAPELQQYRPVINEAASDKFYKYGQEIRIEFQVNATQLDATDFKVTMYPPPFTTHGFPESQRLIILHQTGFQGQVITALAPPSGKIAPPGYYMLFVVYRSVPSKAMWVTIGN